MATPFFFILYFVWIIYFYYDIFFKAVGPCNATTKLFTLTAWL